MAFQYKNPLEIALNKLPSKQSDMLLSKTFDEIEKRLDTVNDLFSFSVTPEQQELLTSNGLELAPIPFRTHSHPMCKMIENHILYIVMPSLLSSIRNVAFFSLRESKANKFIKMFSLFKYGKVTNFKHYNALIDAKDQFRYGNTSFESLRDRVAALKDDCHRAGKFPKVLFIHDELHYLEPEDIAYIFEQIPEISKIVGTLVAPIEIILGDETSREPRVYSFKKDQKGNFFFFPDGCASEGYKQSINHTFWPFKFRCVRWASNSIRVSKLYSLFSHHVFSFDRGRSIDGTVSLNKPSCLLTEELDLISKNFSNAVIERKTLSSIITYMSCLKSGNAASAVAKLRQLEKRELYQDELCFVYSIAKKFSDFGLSEDLTKTIFEKAKEKFISILPDTISNSFFEEKNFQIKIRNLLAKISEKSIIFEREILRLEKSMPDIKKRELFERLGVQPTYKTDRESRPYSIYDGDCNDLEHNLDLVLEKIKVDLNSKIFQERQKSKPFTPERFLHSRKRSELGYFPLRLEYYSSEELKEIEAIKTVRELLTLEGKDLSGDEKDNCKSSKEEKFQVSRGEKLKGKMVEKKDTQLLSLNEASEELVKIAEALNDESYDGSGFEGCIPKYEMQMFKKSNHDIKSARFKRKNDCVFVAFGKHLKKEACEIMDELLNADISDELFDAIDEDKGLSMEVIEEVCCFFNITLVCTIDFTNVFFLNRSKGTERMYVTIKNNHCELSAAELFRKLLKDEKPSAVSTGLSIKPDFMEANLAVCSFARGIKLARSMNRGTTGLIKEINPKFLSEFLEKFEDLSEEKKTFKIATRFGFAGSGKTRRVIEWIKMTPSIKRMFISPRRNLADEVEKDLKGTATRVTTFEVALATINDTYKEIYIDEITLYPPGYVSMLLMSKVSKRISAFSREMKKMKLSELDLSEESVYLLGDPLQIRYHSDLDTGLLDKEHEIDFYMPKSFDYLWQIKRAGKWFRNVLDIPNSGDEGEFAVKKHSDISTVKGVEIILVAAQDEKREFAGRLPVMTFGESQGLTFRTKSLIVISHSTLKTSPNAAIVAITRAKEGFDLMFSGITPKEAGIISLKSVWNYIITGREIPKSRILNMLQGARLISDSVGGLEEKASNDPFIMPFVNLTEEPEEVNEIPEDVIDAPEWFKTHLPTFDCNPLIGEIFEKVQAKEVREFQSSLGMSNQFYDVELKNSKRTDENFPMQFQNIFPHHQASDDVTFLEGVKKRIRKSNTRLEKSKLQALEGVGFDLLKVFLENIPGRFEVTKEDIDFGEESFKKKRAEKSEKLWEAHSNRSDIDWNLNRVLLFMKSQYCTKEGKMFTTAKAGQTLACFQHIVLFKFGPMLRAIEKAFIRSIEDKYYIHSGKNFFCLEAFVTKNQNLFDGESIESDYEAFDSCQDHVVLSFEIALLKHLGVSQSFISDYERIKTELGCGLGNLAIMRFTGEFCTFLFNTFSNMLFTFLKYEIKKESRILFAGDDMCSIGTLRRRGEKTRESELLKLFTLKAIEVKCKYPMFCGWYLTPDGIIKSPKLIFSRICMMVQRGLIKNCIDNYLFEAFFAYKLGEKLYGVLKEEDFEYHYLVVRFFVKNSGLLRGASRELISEIGDSIGKWPSSTSTNSYPKLSQPISKLMPLNCQVCTRMQHFYIQKCSTASRGSRQMLKLQPQMEKDCCCQILNSLIGMKWNSSQNQAPHTSTYIWVQYLLESRPYSRTTRVYLGLSQYMMELVLIVTDLKLLLQHRASNLNLTAVTLSLDPTTVCPLVTNTSEIALDSSSILTVLNIVRTGNCCRWTLECCTDWQTLQDFSKSRVGGMDGFPKVFQGVNSLNSMRKCMTNLLRRDLHYRFKKLVQNYAIRRSYLEEMSLGGQDHSQQKGKFQVVQDQLGRPQSELIDLVEMSLEADLVATRRAHIMTFLWNRHIDPTKDLILEPVVVGAVPDGPGAAAFARVTEFYCKYLFGNIAVYGASPNTTYPNVAFNTPNVTVAGFRRVKRDGKDVDEVHQYIKTWRINLSTIVPEIEGFRTESTNEAVSFGTFRTLCEAFAPDAYKFLKERWPMGVTTNIYDKWPQALSKAPWIAFDFSKGLNKSKLSPDEKMVIDKMTKRLFRTQGQKNVFESAADQNADLEG